jgi:uncharacterized membrane protein
VPRPLLPVAAALLLAVPQAAAAADRIVELAPPAGVTSPTAHALNNKGQVVGAAFFAGQGRRGFVWSQATGFRALAPHPGPSPDKRNAEAFDINDFGDVVGAGQVTDALPFTPADHRALRWTAAAPDAWPVDLGSRQHHQGRARSSAIALNESGDAAGTTAEDGPGENPNQAIFNHAALFHARGGITDVQDVEKSQSNGWDVNAGGAVLGSPRHGTQHPFLWRNGAYDTIDCLAFVGAQQLNDANVVVGAQNGTGVPRSWAAGVCRDLPLPPGRTQAFPEAVNNAGVIVGHAQVGADQSTAVAVIWTPDGKVALLDSLLPEGSGWKLTRAVDVNERGDVLGRGTIGGQERAFLLERERNPLAAGLTATVDEATDLVAVGVTIGNTGDAALDAVRLPSGTGIVKDDTVAPPGGAAGLAAVLGPVPEVPATLPPRSTSAHGVLLELLQPGTTRLFTRVRARGEGGTEHTADASLLLTVEPRPMEPFEVDASVAGAIALLLDQVAEQRRKAVERVNGLVRASLRRSRRPGTKAMLTTSATERAFARAEGLPDDALSWLPKHLARHRDQRLTPRKPGADELLLIFVDEGADRFVRNVGKSVDGIADKLLVTPALFWRDMLFEPRDGERVRAAHELAAMGREGLAATGTFLGEAKRFWTSEAERKAAWAELPKIQAEYAEKLQKGLDAAEDRILRWDRLMHEDPRKGTREFARWLADIESAVVSNAIEDLLQTKLIDGLQAARRLGKATDGAAELGEVVHDTQRLAVRGGSTIARNDQVAKTPLPGLGNMTPQQLDYISDTLGRLSRKHGVDIELQVRPVNGYSARIKDGIGKVEAIPTKNLTPDDVLLGAPADWLGQPAYYRPTLPKGFAKLPAPERQKLQLRFDEKLKELQQFTGAIPDPTGKAAKVKKMLKAGGAEVDLGTAYKAKIQLVTTQKGGATLIQYKKLEVNGKPIFTGKPRPIVSDFDINALVDRATGRHLPAGIRGQVELEVMNAFRKAQYEGLIPFGFHGWTHSGFDLASKDFRHVVKHMLMYASDDQALRFARHWAPKFFPHLGAIADPRKHERAFRKAVEEILAGYTRGKHLVRITAEEARLGPGVDPTAGIPLPR